MTSTVTMIYRTSIDEQFQAACQRYARGNGSSPAIAAAALRAVGAPELLAQAEKHLAWLCKLTDWAGADDPDLDGLRAAIAKAKGEQA